MSQTNYVAVLALATSDSATTLRLCVDEAPAAREGGKPRQLFASIRIAGKAHATVESALDALARTPGSTRVALPRQGDGVLQLAVRPVLLCVDAAILFAAAGGRRMPVGRTPESVTPDVAREVCDRAGVPYPESWAKGETKAERKARLAREKAEREAREKAEREAAAAPQGEPAPA